MRIATYRSIVIGTVLCSFLVGLHLPGLRHMVGEHGAQGYGVLSITVLLAILVAVGTTALLRSASRMRS